MLEKLGKFRNCIQRAVLGTEQHLNAQGKRMGRAKAAVLVPLQVGAVERRESLARLRRRQVNVNLMHVKHNNRLDYVYSFRNVEIAFCLDSKSCFDASKLASRNTAGHSSHH